jgi:hypothetical protein
MKFTEPLHTGPHTGARTGPRIGPHTGLTAGPARLPVVLPGQTGYLSDCDSPKYISSGRKDEPTEPVTQGREPKASGLWSGLDRNIVSDPARPFGRPPRQQRRSATEGIGPDRAVTGAAAGGASAPAVGDEPVPRWPKTIRLSEQWTVTEKIDGTHVTVVIESAATDPADQPGISLAEGPAGESVTVRAASRTRWLVTESEAAAGVGRDNFGFAAWVAAHAAELAILGPGAHHGEWYGAGIGHGYGLTERRFALFDTVRWQRGLPDGVPEDIGVVPVLADCVGSKLNATIARCLRSLARNGSRLVKGAAAEGVIARSTAEPRLALKAYIEGSGMEAVQSRHGPHPA